MDSVVDTVRHSVDKMNNLMQQLKGAMPSADVATVDMAKLLPDVVSGKASHRPKPELTSITQGLFVRGDRDKIATVIGHVIQNAVDATRKDGFVRVGLLGRDDWAVVEVTDNGIGMDTAFVKNRLFRPFDSTKGLTGMGIGAYESRELVRALGGDIKVSSESGKGSQFRIQFPLVKVELAAETKKQEVAG
jgi:signal transduction histidine kinase